MSSSISFFCTSAGWRFFFGGAVDRVLYYIQRCRKGFQLFGAAKISNPAHSLVTESQMGGEESEGRGKEKKQLTVSCRACSNSCLELSLSSLPLRCYTAALQKKAVPSNDLSFPWVKFFLLSSNSSSVWFLWRFLLSSNRVWCYTGIRLILGRRLVNHFTSRRSPTD